MPPHPACLSFYSQSELWSSSVIEGNNSRSEFCLSLSPECLGSVLKQFSMFSNSHCPARVKLGKSICISYTDVKGLLHASQSSSHSQWLKHPACGWRGWLKHKTEDLISDPFSYVNKLGVALCTCIWCWETETEGSWGLPGHLVESVYRKLQFQCLAQKIRGWTLEENTDCWPLTSFTHAPWAPACVHMHILHIDFM